MKKRIILLFLIFLSIFIVRNVSAKEVNVSIKDIEVVEKNNTEVDGKLEFDGLELKSNIKFYDVGDYIKYKVTLKNDDKRDYQIKDITDNNTSESMILEYEGKDIIIKAGKEESFTVTVTYTKHITNDITRLSNNVYSENQEVKIKLQLNEYFSLINPTTGRNIILIVIALIMLFITLNYVLKNKKIKTMIVILFLLLSVTKVVKADEVITVNFTIKQENEVKISFMDKNWKDIDMGDFTKIEFVKIDKDKSDAYDISAAKDRTIIEWVDNGILYIGSYHNVYAPIDSSCLFSMYSGYGSNWYSISSQSSKMENVVSIEFNKRLMTNYVTNMHCMFLLASSLDEIDMSCFDISNVTNNDLIFHGMDSLEKLITPKKMPTDSLVFDLPNIFMDNNKTEYEKFDNTMQAKTELTLSEYIATFVSGTTFNQKLKRLAGNITATFSTEDNNIIAIKRSEIKPNEDEMTDDNIISNNNKRKIYAWFDNGTIYYYSDYEKPYTNSVSSYMFYNMRSLQEIELDMINTSRTRNMLYMFYNTGSDTTTFRVTGLSDWNTSKVTDMSFMFSNAGYDATTWSIGNLSNWNTSSVIDMKYMFYLSGRNATTWNIDNLSNWNTSSVTDMKYMFYGAGYNATTWSIGDLSNWNTLKVTNMSHMFDFAGYNATKFSPNLSNWNTSSVTDMSYMFSDAGHNATTWSIGDLSNWNTSKVTDMSHMFAYAGYNATKFSPNLSNWNTSKVTDMSWMFSFAGYNAPTFSFDLSNWNTLKVTNMSHMFAYAGYNATVWGIGVLSNWNTSSVIDMKYMFCLSGRNATTWNIGNLSKWNTSNVTDMSSIFDCAGFNATTFSLDLSNWDTSKVTNMSLMFMNAGWKATTWSIGNLSNWDTSEVTNMSGMFWGAGSNATTFSIVGLSNWDTSKVTDMSAMFNGAGHNATTWNVGSLSNWDTSEVTSMLGMFWGAGKNATTWNSIGTLNVYAPDLGSIFREVPKAKATINIYNNPTDYDEAFSATSTTSGSGITVNYKSSVTDIDNIINTKSSNSNVFKGSVIS